MTIAIAQTAPALGDLEGNLLGIERAFAAAAARGARLTLFPELALTGYALQDAVANVALAADSPRLVEIASKSRGGAFVLGFVEEGEPGAFHNSALIAVDGRPVAVHRKRHLPTYALFDEGRFFKPGRGITLFELEGWKLGLLICEEAWYPQTVHEVIAAGADVLVVLANGPGRGTLGGARWQTQDAWRELVRFYARTYLVPVFLVNRTGIEEGLFFGGCSAVVEPGGRVAAEAPLFDETILYGELSRSALRRARMRSPGRPTEPLPAFDTLLFPPAPSMRTAETDQGTVPPAASRDGSRGASAPAGARANGVRTGAPAGRPQLPGLEPGLAKEALCRFIQTQVLQAGAAGAVLGLSGGIDSAVTSALCAAALGPERVHGMHLPSMWSREEDRRDALEQAQALGISVETVPLSELRIAYLALEPKPGRLREGNFTARLRMALLYDRSARDGVLVVGNANKTEALLGYTTLWGDMAAAFSPLGDLYKTQVRILAEHLGVSRAILEKPPSAGLWTGQTDEEELGATYEELDSLLYHYVDLRHDLESLVAAGFDEAFARRIVARVHAHEFKRRMPLIPKLSNRTIGHDWLYPRHWTSPGSQPRPPAAGRVVEPGDERNLPAGDRTLSPRRP